MCKSLSIILVAALATTSAFAAPRYYGSTAPKSYAVTKPSKPRASEAEKKMAEEENFDIKKMSAHLKNEAKK